MKFSVHSDQSLEKQNLDILVFGVFSKKTGKDEKSVFYKTIEGIDSLLGGEWLKHVAATGFHAKAGQVFWTQTLGKITPATVAVIGLGDQSKIELDTIRKFGGHVFGAANRHQGKKIGICLPTLARLKSDEIFEAISEGLLLNSYRFDKYLSEKHEQHLQEVALFYPKAKANKSIFDQSAAICDAVFLARDLINEGPIVLTPPEFAKRAQQAGKKAGLSVEVLDEKALEKERFNLMLAVGRAARDAAPPRLVRIAYRPQKKAAKHIVLVGKGLTFDSGGLDIKPSAGMLDMKIDMSGAAAVLGTLLAVAHLKPKVAVTGYLACAENGVGSHSYHPGDILVSRKGLSIEINNTDAEGRLVLADALDYAQEREKPDILIDLATLTGASMVALGPWTAAAFSPSDKLCDQIATQGKREGETFWQMPLDERLFDQLKTPIADMKNSGERYGGAITGALFLKKFIHNDVEWAHLDIAGPASNEKEHAYIPKGGVGFPIRTLAKLISEI